MFGDSFGGLNALFSGLAFAGLLVIILMQRREIKLQQEDLNQTRKVLSLQKEEMQRTALANEETFKLQKELFENQKQAYYIEAINTSLNITAACLRINLEKKRALMEEAEIIRTQSWGLINPDKSAGEHSKQMAKKYATIEKEESALNDNPDKISSELLDSVKTIYPTP